MSGKVAPAVGLEPTTKRLTAAEDDAQKRAIDSHRDSNRSPFSPENEDVRLAPGAVARRCACRGWVVGPETPNGPLTVSVMQHQLDEPHKSYDWQTWREENTAKVDVPIATLRRVA